MSHEIDLSNGRANMAFTGLRKNIWHGLGQELSENASIETWIEEAGMNWEALISPVMYQADGIITKFKTKNVIYREDTLAPLSVVSDKYKVVQPSEILEFFRDLTEASGFTMETAGCLFGGKKLWAMAKVGESALIGGEDEIKPYLLLGTSLDGTMATAAHFTSVRVVCNNTLRMAIGANGHKAQIKVPHSAKFDHGSVKENLGVAQEVWGQFVETSEKLANIYIPRDYAIELVARSLKIDTSDSLTEQLLGESRILNSIIGLYEGAGIGSQMKSAKGTGWGLVNSVTQYFDHEVASRGFDRSGAVDRSQFGDRAAIKTDLADRILAEAA